MGCSCSIDVDCDGGPDAFSSAHRKARKEHKCCECGKAIQPGEVYCYESGIWEGRPSSHKTCLDCLSARDAYFCGFIYGRLWSDLREEVLASGGDMADARIAELTPAAREKVCAMIEEAWESGDEDEE